MDGRTITLGQAGLRAVQVVALALVAFKFVHLFTAGVFMDEAYYWMWGQHPALSYFDHPPLNAWALGLSSGVFGWNIFALRLPVGVAFLADIAALYLLARRLAGVQWPAHFWVSLLLFVGTPIYWMVTSLALPDHLLLTFTLFALAWFVRFFGDRGEGQRGEGRDLYLGALSLGLAGLSKYNAAFLGVALVLYVLLYDRPLLRQARLYLAGALTLLMQLPVVVWNFGAHFASWEFILHGRHAGLKASADGLYPFVGSILIFVSPILFWPIARFLLERRRDVPALGLARVAFVLSSTAILAVAFTTLVLFHWNLVAYAAMLPFLAFFLRPRWLLGLQAIYGIAFAAFVFVNYAVQPVVEVGRFRDEATAWSYGWDTTAAAVGRVAAEHPVGFIATADYTTASLLGFALHDRDVVSLSPHTDQYDYWFDRQAHAGEDAILFGDQWRPLSDAITRQFDKVELVETVEIRRGGALINRQRIYLATGFVAGD